MKIKILKDFYNPLSKRTLKAGSSIEIDADDEGTPTHSFWYEQLRFKENESYFEKVTTKPISTNSKSKSK